MQIRDLCITARNNDKETENQPGDLSGLIFLEGLDKDDDDQA